MAEKTPEQKGTPFLWFFIVSIALNVGAAFSGYYWSLPAQTIEADTQLTAIDVNDVPSLREPNAATAPPIPPPSPEPAPTPAPPPDQPPEFEVQNQVRRLRPHPHLTPTPEPTPTPAPEPESTPKSMPRPQPSVKPAARSTSAPCRKCNCHAGLTKG